jgi:hypothetical protein
MMSDKHWHTISPAMNQRITIRYDYNVHLVTFTSRIFKKARPAEAGYFKEIRVEDYTKTRTKIGAQVRIPAIKYNLWY